MKETHWIGDAARAYLHPPQDKKREETLNMPAVSLQGLFDKKQTACNVLEAPGDLRTGKGRLRLCKKSVD